jgi:hypothetical protein
MLLGAPHTLAVSLGRGVSAAGTVIFDDAVARSQSLAPIGYYSAPDALVWGTSAAWLYVSRYSEEIPLERDIASVTVGSSGLTIANSVSIDPSKYAFGETFYGAGRAYDIYGRVVDTSSGARCQFNLPGNRLHRDVIADPAHGRVFFHHSQMVSGYCCSASTRISFCAAIGGKPRYDSSTSL